MPVELTKRDDCALLRLNRPEALSALSFSILNEIAAAMHVDSRRLARLHQVHGAHAVVAAPEAERPDADIAVSQDPSVALAIQTADCVPLLMIDTGNGAAAVAHAGWRGLALRVPVVAIEELARQFGSRPRDLIAAVGPSIGPCCYEVGSDVRAAFENGRFGSGEVARWFRDQPVPTPRNPSMRGLHSPRPGHWPFFGGTFVAM